MDSCLSLSLTSMLTFVLPTCSFLLNHGQAYMFAFSGAFNRDIGNWDVRRGINFVSPVVSCNQKINFILDALTVVLTCILSAFLHIYVYTYLTSKDSMFDNANSFNQDIRSWDVRKGKEFVSIVLNS